MPGVPELLVILVIVMLIFGAGKLPAIGGALGKSIKSFKKSMSSDDEVEGKERPKLATRDRRELEDGEAEEDDLDGAEREPAEVERKQR